MAKKKKKSDDNLETINDVIDTICQKFGAGAIIQGQVIIEAETIPTGSPTLDIALGVGGVPRGRITEIYGPEGSGKTTLGLHLVANVQKNGGSAAYIDIEHALDPTYASNIGVDLNKLLISQPNCGEDALITAELLCKSGLVDIVIVDSVAALVPRAELEGNIGDHHVGAQARMMSQSLRKIVGVVHTSNTALVFINQLREKVGILFGSPETTPGGRALKFYSSVRMEIRRKSSVTSNEGRLGNTTKVKIVKNKLAAPFKEAEFDIIFGKGISRSGSVLDLGVEHEVLIKKGSNYYYGDRRLGNSKTNAMEALEEDLETLESIEQHIFEKLGINSPTVEDKNKTEVLEPDGNCATISTG